MTRRAARRLILLSQRAGAAWLWSLAYRAVTRAVAVWLARGLAAAVHLRGGLASGDAVYGVSDIDLVVVVPGDGRERVRARQRALRRVLPWIAAPVSVAVYTEAELAAAVAAPAFTAGLERDPPRAVYFGPEATRDECGLRERPGVYGPTDGWRRVAGPARELPVQQRDAQGTLAAAWLDLQFLWAHAFGACAHGPRAEDAYLSVKLVADSARLELWLERGERVASRTGALRRALEVLPSEREALETALALHGVLDQAPEPAFASSLPALARATERVAAHLETAAAAAGARRVRLLWDGTDDLLLGPDEEERRTRLVPLADWRARVVVPHRLDEVLLPRPGDPGDPATLGAAGREGSDGPLPALRSGRLLALPSTDHWGRAILRSVQCRQTDPVSFALLDAGDAAEFPELPGWSARDCARRALAEHTGWLAAPPRDAAEGGRELDMLVSAVRAAHFHAGLDSSEPALAVTARAALRALEEAAPAERALAGEAAHALGERRRSPQASPPPDLLAALRAVVASLDAYRSR